jgi:transcriptional regulator with XRE-family HTH domain
MPSKPKPSPPPGTFRALRERARLTQDALAERAHVAQVTISAIEIGKSRHPRFETVQRLAVALGVTVERLFDAIRATEEA